MKICLINFYSPDSRAKLSVSGLNFLESVETPPKMFDQGDTFFRFD